ncbi:G-type lectin S-receptor-like serine/threonine-protein kinase LECRK3 [Tanacetum coccineum]|uniref:G-type lectin S-receptor-like serine/threonine-protein kinase LECRK3 n=1 Tax=Tanacetum coccineum TaxID=301880 RepID=A0ABQ5G907_9ASTR
MAEFILHIIFLTTFLHGLAAQRTNGSVSVGASLRATRDATPWLSPSGEFAFGFQQVQGNENFLLSIWYDKIPEKTIVWYPENGPMVSQGSKVELANGLGLVLSDPQGRQVWSSGSISDLAYGAMNDTGIHIANSGVMPEMTWIKSKMSETNFTDGRFQLRLLEDGSLVLNSIDLLFGSAGYIYYSSDTKDESNSTNSGDKLILDVAGYMYILKRNGERSDLTVRGAIPSGDYYFRATLDFDGVFNQYYYPKNPTGNTSWEVICTNDNRRPVMPTEGFSLFDSNDPLGDCKPDFSPSCDEVYSEDQFDFIELRDIDWPGSDFAFMNPSNEEDCKTSCLKDCFCAIAIHRDNKCWKKKLPLSNGKTDFSLNVKAFLKYRKGDRPPQNPPVLLQENKNQRSLIVVGSALLGTSVFVIVVLICVICIASRRHLHGSVAPSLRSGPRVAFGIVYKGVIGTRTVAVKKLRTVDQDAQKEFKTEVNTIAKTHHKNLVQLLGYCDDGDQQLLVYEYMSNGTLAVFLFGETRPSWKQRSDIGVGIAKGLGILHESEHQIIHCDIKPQNILLDEYYTAKISDFGLAKLLIMNQSRTDTGIRGTKGYVAPEWFRNTLVTVKDAEVLTDWAWDCYQEEYPSLRANHEEGIQMLEELLKLCNPVEVTEPPCPSPFSTSVTRTRILERGIEELVMAL